jgi:uncharacterized protein (DUF1501 family)
MKRRQFLSQFMALGALSALPGIALSRSRNTSRTLILVELKGGNDGLNTIAPYRDKEYYRLRPRLAIPASNVLALNDELGLNPALQALLPLWNRQQLAVVNGLGYPNPNFSHFRSIEIWQTGSGSEETLQQGWIARQYQRDMPDGVYASNGIVLDNELGPLSGGAMHSIVMRNPKQFIRQARNLHHYHADTNNRALQHILNVQNGIEATAGDLEAKLDGSSVPLDELPNTPLGKQFAVCAQMIINNTSAPIIKTATGSFDTHTNQANRHNNLLSQLAEAIAAFEKSMRKYHKWNDVLIVTYSEFGRRPAENGNRGTDHGTAAPHFIIGGKVRGGLYGQQPSLEDLEKGNLKFTTDFRTVYSSIIKDWWQIPAQNNIFAEFGNLEIL